MGIKKKYKGNDGYGKSSLEILYVYIRIKNKEKIKIKKIIKKHIQENRFLSLYILNFILVIDRISSFTHEINNRYFC